ncbi:c-type cytochrome [Pandoraea sp. NPDC087047]|uniref:c-type cytochrome n=1 Tax=Pandoraea sp. NPDC087047 TaxID=3364390 RepID=UPI003803C7D4
MTRPDDELAGGRRDGTPSPGIATRAAHVTAAGNAPAHDEDGPHAAYAWPIWHGEATAQMEASAQRRDDGTLRTWHYHADVEGVNVLADGASTSQTAGRAVIPPPLYRHETSAAHVIDPGHRIPAQAHAFARESFIDEVAAQESQDPVEYRLRHLAPGSDDGAREVIRMVAQRAAWGAPPSPGADIAPQGWQRGRGFAFDGQSARASTDGNADADTWSAWIIDLDVNPQSGEIAIRRVVAGQASGHPGEALSVDGLPAGQIADALRQALGTTWRMDTDHDEIDAIQAHSVVAHAASSPANGALATSPTSEDTDRLIGSAAPAAAAIANAVFNATGVRLRRPPFDPESLRHALRDSTGAMASSAPSRDARRTTRWRRWLASGGIGGLIGLAGVMLFGPGEIAPISAADNTLWSTATLERGRQIALAGDCAVCHTAPKGAVNAGGLALETPFGTVYSTNITPDPETGIGRWSYAAFARAMREGISRDGAHLYPAFPYTAFAKMSEPDMLALYGYLMSQPPVANAPPKTALPFPLNQRRLVAGWNWLYHDVTEYRPDPSQSTLWNRGRYLVDGAGHCGACHTPRNMLGAEQTKQYLKGGEAEGWRAPPLVASKDSPVPWTESALFDYLRTGFSPEHGVAAGPMAPVVAGLAALPETDVRAIAHYLVSLSPKPDAAQVADLARQRAKGADIATTLGLENGRRTFEAACAVCHTDSGGVGHFGVRPLMGLNTSVSQAKPDNLMHVLMNGIDRPATEALGYMPGFRDSFDDRQMAELAAFIRARYAPDQPAWQGLEASAAGARDAHPH